MHRWAGAALPYWDAFAAVLSLIAQWLLARKALESWILWIVVDVVSIGIYSAKELYLTAGLYVIFLGLAITGLMAWRRDLARE
jgi:nicotinamide mononucleotide transporter